MIESFDSAGICPGCGKEMEKKELGFGKAFAAGLLDRENRYRFRKDISIRRNKLRYCPNCVYRLDIWTEKCACCGRRIFFGGAEIIGQKYYCWDCFKAHCDTEPATVDGSRINLHYPAYELWRRLNPGKEYELRGTMTLTGKTPVIELFEDGEHVRSYELGNLPEEDYNGMFLHYSIRLNSSGTGLRLAQIDGLVNESAEKEPSGRETGYRFEGYVLKAQGASEQSGRVINGNSLAEKGLRYPGYITPGNVRLVGICRECKKSITFSSVNFPMMGCIPCYSDNGLELGEMSAYDGEDRRWSREIEGKVFRYTNSFRCVHCGSSYLDYSKAESKYGLYGCLYLGHKVYREQ